MRQAQTKPFTASQFTATQWESAEDKARFANHFVRFVRKGFPRSLFHKWFYNRLSMTFGHIAHYNQSGFFVTQFGNPHKIVSFFRHTLQNGGYGDPTYTYSDVERTLKAWLINQKTLEQWEGYAQGLIEQNERAELARLKSQYPDADQGAFRSQE